MNIADIDLSLVPWPMFLLLVFFIGFILWYLNIFIPLSENYEKLKDVENKNINDLKSNIDKLNDVILDINNNVDTFKLDNTRIISILSDIEKYADGMNKINIYLNEKENTFENKIDIMKRKMDELEIYITNLKKDISE